MLADGGHKNDLRSILLQKGLDVAAAACSVDEQSCVFYSHMTWTKQGGSNLCSSPISHLCLIST